MGLLDSVLGAVLGGQQSGGANAASGVPSGLGRLISLVTSNPQLLQAITGMLSNEGAQGGLSGLIAKFQQAGMGEVVASWVGSGANQAISGSQLTDVLGSDAMAGLAAKLGLSQGEAADQLSDVLPGVIDKLTPQGQAPQAGLGNVGELMGMLDGLLQKN